MEVIPQVEWFYFQFASYYTQQADLFGSGMQDSFRQFGQPHCECSGIAGGLERKTRIKIFKVTGIINKIKATFISCATFLPGIIENLIRQKDLR